MYPQSGLKYVTLHVYVFCRYIEGKHRQSVSKAATYDKRLYLVTGRKYARAACVRLSARFV